MYADSGGVPSALLGTSNPLTFTSTSAAGWYDLTFATPLNLTPANYWIGVITGATERRSRLPLRRWVEPRGPQ